jgi:peptidoglycan hydrolase-like protein with peptidoglycan-binding domain
VRERHDLSDPTPWRRSLRASQARRAGAAARRRRSTRSRGALTAALLGLSVAATGALAAPASKPSAAPASAVAAAGVKAAQAKLGITADGIAGPQTRRAIKRFQRTHGLTVDGVIGPATLGALGISATPARSSLHDVGDPEAELAKIAACESGGDPTAVSRDGHYRGKYQFTRATWRSLGATGDPAKAPEATQDAMAAKLLALRGTAPWPVCG